MVGNEDRGWYADGQSVDVSAAVAPSFEVDRLDRRSVSEEARILAKNSGNGEELVVREETVAPPPRWCGSTEASYQHQIDSGIGRAMVDRSWGIRRSTSSTAPGVCRCASPAEAEGQTEAHRCAWRLHCPLGETGESPHPAVLIPATQSGGWGQGIRAGSQISHRFPTPSWWWTPPHPWDSRSVSMRFPQ